MCNGLGEKACEANAALIVKEAGRKELLKFAKTYLKK